MRRDTQWIPIVFQVLLPGDERRFRAEARAQRLQAAREAAAAANRALAAAAVSAEAVATSAAISKGQQTSGFFAMSFVSSCGASAGPSSSQMAGLQYSQPPLAAREELELQQLELLRLQLEKQLKEATDKETKNRNRKARVESKGDDVAALEGLDDSVLDDVEEVINAVIHAYMDSRLDDEILKAVQGKGRAIPSTTGEPRGSSEGVGGGRGPFETPEYRGGKKVAVEVASHPIEEEEGEANKMAKELEVIKQQREQIQAQVDLQGKFDIISRNIELLAKAWDEQHQFARAQDIALHSISLGFKDFAREMMMTVGAEMQARIEGTEKFCTGAIEGAKLAAPKEEEVRPHRESVKIKFPEPYSGKTEENFDNWEANVNIYVYLQKIVAEEQVLIALQALKDEAANFARSLDHIAQCENNMVAYSKIIPLPEFFRVLRERFADVTRGARALDKLQTIHSFQWRSARALKGIMDELVAVPNHGVTETQLVNLFYCAMPEPVHLAKPPTGVVSRPIHHRIEIEPGSRIPKGVVYRMSLRELEELRKQLDKLLEKGWIRPRSSPFGAPVLFVPKEGELRMCIDYRGLNVVKVKNAEPLPHIDDLLDQVQGCKYFSKIDLKSGYHQIEVHPDDQYKTTFRTRYGHYEFITNAPATFQRCMNDLLRLWLDKFMVVHLDDILVFSKTLQEHGGHLRQVLEKLREVNFKINAQKCEWAKTQVLYLGLVLDKDDITPEDSNIAVIRDCSMPRMLTELRSFLGLANYYRKFVWNFSIIAAHLRRLLKIEAILKWDKDCTSALKKLKRALIEYPVLKVADLSPHFVVTTDASQYDINVVLQQDDGNGYRPVEFMLPGCLQRSLEHHPTVGSAGQGMLRIKQDEDTGIVAIRGETLASSAVREERGRMNQDRDLGSGGGSTAYRAAGRMKLESKIQEGRGSEAGLNAQDHDLIERDRERCKEQEVSNGGHSAELLPSGQEREWGRDEKRERVRVDGTPERRDGLGQKTSSAHRSEPASHPVTTNCKREREIGRESKREGREKGDRLSSQIVSRDSKLTLLPSGERWAGKKREVKGNREQHYEDDITNDEHGDNDNEDEESDDKNGRLRCSEYSRSQKQSDHSSDFGEEPPKKGSVADSSLQVDIVGGSPCLSQGRYSGDEDEISLGGGIEENKASLEQERGDGGRVGEEGGRARGSDDLIRRGRGRRREGGRWSRLRRLGVDRWNYVHSMIKGTKFTLRRGRVPRWRKKWMPQVCSRVASELASVGAVCLLVSKLSATEAAIVGLHVGAVLGCEFLEMGGVGGGRALSHAVLRSIRKKWMVLSSLELRDAEEEEETVSGSTIGAVNSSSEGDATVAEKAIVLNSTGEEVGKGHGWLVGEGRGDVLTADPLEAGNEDVVAALVVGNVLTEGTDILDEAVGGAVLAKPAKLVDRVVDCLLWAEGGGEEGGPLEKGERRKTGGVSVGGFCDPPAMGDVDKFVDGNGKSVDKGDIVEFESLL
ncbi:hypothetical protein CBR_g11241 [Chara braunii]|uniref:Reverse transcriptase domain-containing protein n=1 Tax=Chara braunii TaxID=69332 RepID=A0A388KQK5_CHABU|nr:hypothetical protein CBR_g11241 [Chara braunii]|eukprot:GBG72312.1 hypothetical protein CBR_g11241 [Chara braunii]